MFNDVEYTYKVRRCAPGRAICWPARLPDPHRHAREADPAAAGAASSRCPPPRGWSCAGSSAPPPDLAGYRVHRRGSGEEQPARLTTELLTKPHFVDGRVNTGPDVPLLRDHGGQLAPGQRSSAVGDDVR